MRAIQVTKRNEAVIQVLSESGGELPLPDLTRRLGLAPATARRTIQGLGALLAKERDGTASVVRLMPPHLPALAGLRADVYDTIWEQTRDGPTTQAKVADAVQVSRSEAHKIVGQLVRERWVVRHRAGALQWVVAPSPEATATYWAARTRGAHGI